MNITAKLAAGAAATALRTLGYDPQTIGQLAEARTRADILFGVEALEGAGWLLPPAPPAELAAAIAAAAEREQVPAVLLEAVSWECARYGPEQSRPDTAGPMALPSRFGAAELADQVHGAARALAVGSADHGAVAALIRYCGGAELARRVAGTAVLLAAARAGLPHGAAGTLKAFLGWS
jgi:hypothetical protein